MLDDLGGPESDQSVNHELDWLRDIYRIVDPRFNRVTRDSLECALAGLDIPHLSFVRDLNSAILQDQLEIFGGSPQSYEQISLYTDYVVVDAYVTKLIGKFGADAVAVATGTPQSEPTSRPLVLHDRGFTWDPRRRSSQYAFRVSLKRRLGHFVSKLWGRPAKVGH